jgi:hypothetical protein
MMGSLRLDILLFNQEVLDITKRKQMVKKCLKGGLKKHC